VVFPSIPGVLACPTGTTSTRETTEMGVRDAPRTECGEAAAQAALVSR